MAHNTPSTLVTFDFEGSWGMPHEAPYDLPGTTDTILEILDHNGVKALFFVVGRIVEETPEIISKIDEAGHAVGLHGYRHERLNLLTPMARLALKVELQTVCGLVEQITGQLPVAFRAPYLLSPKYTDAAITEMLSELGFLWTSNREIRFVEELFRPDRMPWQTAYRFAERLGALTDRRPLGVAMLAALNAQHLWQDPDLGRLSQRLDWLFSGRAPFARANLVELAIGAPLDCDLLGLPIPSEDTSDAMLAFATNCLIEGAKRRGNPYVLTFHDWIIGSGNRAPVLDDVLSALSSDGSMLDARCWRPALGE